MCDTLLYKGKDHTLFAKNSDREPNEAQAILHLPRQQQTAKTVQCTFIEILQVPETFEVLLSKPFQMWGAEMGINEHGVVIGNEAVFTKIKEPRKNNGLTGMDMIRLALERCTTAENALETIRHFIEKYGQDACGGYQDKRFYYHNSFLIADVQQAFKLESAGRHWVFQEVKNSDSISNGLTIGSDFDGISSEAIDFAKKKKWVKQGIDFSFADAFSDRLYTTFSRCKIRRSTTFNSMKDLSSFSVKNAIQILQSHHVAENFDPAKATAACICMHPTGLLNPSQTNGSMIVKLAAYKPPEIRLTGTSLPCLSIYKPWRLGEKLDIGITPSAKADGSLWWQAERAHRMICRDYQRGIALHWEIFKNHQAQLFEKDEMPQLVWDEYRERLNLLNEQLISSNIRIKSNNPIYRINIKKWSRNAGLGN